MLLQVSFPYQPANPVAQVISSTGFLYRFKVYYPASSHFFHSKLYHGIKGQQF